MKISPSQMIARDRELMEMIKQDARKEMLADVLKTLGLDEYIELEVQRQLDKHILHDH